MDRAFDDYVISTDRQRLDLRAIHSFLAEQSYWARGVTRETVEKSIANSIPFGAYRNGEQVGFARVVTDRATFAWLADVYILESERGSGLGKALIACVMDHPDVSGVRRHLLATRDAHGLYARYGFGPLERTERFMVIEPPATLPAHER
jgi:GNAT superfamily N-acetyltransferase